MHQMNMFAAANGGASNFSTQFIKSAMDATHDSSLMNSSDMGGSTAPLNLSAKTLATK
jgi:hypothetical protein